MTKVAHIIHSTGIGGVETSVDLLRRSITAFDYRVLAWERSEPATVVADAAGNGVNSPTTMVRLWSELERFAPDIVVSSLWRSVLIGGLFTVMQRLRRRRVRWVIYLHNSRYTQFVDHWVHRWAFSRCDLVMGDSAAAIDALVPTAVRSRTEVVRPDSPLLSRLKSRQTPAPSRSGRATTRADSATTASSAELEEPIRIVYWGRATATKRLDLSLALLERLERMAPGRFVWELMCPPSDRVDEVVRSAGHSEVSVIWHGTGDSDAIIRLAQGASFFLLLSEFEGLSIAVREAMALGLVPIVTPVGEIGSYSDHGVDAVHVEPSDEGIDEAARTVLAISADPTRFITMSREAAVSDHNDFTHDFETAVLSTVGRRPRS